MCPPSRWLALETHAANNVIAETDGSGAAGTTHDIRD